MVLYGYDASVYNAVLGSKNWLAWFGTPEAPLDSVSIHHAKEAVTEC